MTTLETVPYHEDALAPDQEAYERSECVYDEVSKRLHEFYDENRFAQLQEMGVRRPELTWVGSQYGHKLYNYDQTSHERNNSYKIHGSANAGIVAKQQNPALKRIYTASAGNHGEGVSVVGDELDLETIVETAMSASEVKVSKMRRIGAEVRNRHDNLPLALEAAQEAGEAEDSVFIHPYNDLDVLTGQSVMGVQLVEDLYAQGVTGDVVVHAPVGGGGFITGLVMGSRFAMEFAQAGGYEAPFRLTIVGVQMEHGDPARRAVANYYAGLPYGELGDLFPEEEPDNANDGTFAVPGDLTLPVLADRTKVSDIMSVSKAEVGQAMHDLTRWHSKPIEPAGALSRAGAVAWAREHATTPLAADGVTLITYTTGSNVSAEHYRHFMDATARERAENERQRQAELTAYRENLTAFVNAGLGQVALRNDYFTTSVAASPTHQYRTGLVEPTPRSRR